MSSPLYQAGITYTDGSLDDALQGRAAQIEQGNFPSLQDSSSGSTWKDRVTKVGKALARAASTFDYEPDDGSDDSYRANLDDLIYQPTNSTTAKYTSTPATNREFKLQTLQSYTADAMAKVDEQRVQIGQKAVQNLHRNIVNVLDQLSQAQGLPTYREWHAKNGIAYTLPSDPGTLGLAQLQNQQNTSNYRAQEDRQQIQANLQHGQTPLKFADWQAAQQQVGASNPDNLMAGFKNNPAGQTQLVASLSAGPIAQSKSSSAWQNLQSGAVLDDSELKQVFHDIDLRYYGATTDQDKRQAELLRLYTVNKQAENMVAQAERDKDGNVLLSGVSVRHSDAMYFARVDVQHFEQTDRHITPKDLNALKEIKASGTRPNDENPTAYQMLERSNAALGKVGQTEHDRELLWEKKETERKSAEALRQKMKNLYSYNELKEHYAMDPEAAAWQLGFKKTFNKFLYGLHNQLESIKDSRSGKPNYKYPPSYTTYDLSLEAHFPNRTHLGSMAADSMINKRITNLLPSYKNKPFIEKWIREQARGKIIGAGTDAVKAQSSRKNK